MAYAFYVSQFCAQSLYSELKRCADKYGQVAVAHAKNFIGKHPSPSEIGLVWTAQDIRQAKIQENALTYDIAIVLPNPRRTEEIKIERCDALDSMLYAADTIRKNFNEPTIRKYLEHDVNLVKEVFESLNKKGANEMTSTGDYRRYPQEKTEAEKIYEEKCLEAEKELNAAKAKEAEEKELARKRSVAKDLRDWYQALTDAGFSEDQAWMLVFEKVKGGD